MTLKIKAETLKNFIVKTTANGLVKDCKLVFSDTGLAMRHKDENGVVLILAQLDKSAFAEYEPMELPMKNTDQVIQALKSFGDNIINIVKAGTMAKFFDADGGFDFALGEVIDCAYDKATPELTYNNQILVKKTVLKSIVDRSRIVKSESVLCQNVGKELILQIGEETDKAQTRMPTTCEVDVSAVFNLEYFRKLTENFEPIFDLSIGFDGVPSKFMEKTDKFSAIYFLTPVTNAETAAPK